MRNIISTLLMIVMVIGSSIASGPELGRIRSAFVEATQNEEAREALIQHLKSTTINNNYRDAYLGATKTLLAESAINPWTKWNHFQEGKNLIESAIKSDPSNAEFRYLRFLVQFNAPSFLDYSDQLKEDYDFIMQSINASNKDDEWTNYFHAFRVKHTEEIEDKIHPQS